MKGKTIGSGDYTPEQREEILQKMQAASNGFYSVAVRTGCHAFIEFCGLMNEFIVVCREAEKAGIDFTTANTHTGQTLPFAEHNAEYLGEKLNCIYGLALINNPVIGTAFVQAIFGEGVVLVKEEYVQGALDD
jgi:hypothetical protein